MRYKLIIACVLLGIVVLFTLQNTEPVNIAFLFWTFAMSRAVLVFLVLVAGVAAGFLLGSHSKKCKEEPKPKYGP